MIIIVFTGTGVSGANSLSSCNGIGNSTSGEVGKVENIYLLNIKILKL